MKALLSIAVGCALFLGSGCAVAIGPAAKKTGSSQSSLKSSGGDCAPNQYWDGNQCRHKGKGHGARKHDG